MKCEKLDVPKWPVVECPHCLIPILLTEENKNKRRVKTFMAQQHEFLECLQFGRMMRKLNPYSIAKFKLAMKNLNEIGEIGGNGGTIESHNNPDQIADILLHLKRK